MRTSAYFNVRSNCVLHSRQIAVKNTSCKKYIYIYIAIVIIEKPNGGSHMPNISHPLILIYMENLIIIEI